MPSLSHLARGGSQHQQKGGAIGSKVFVGNLSFDTSSEALQSLFAEVGEVASVVVPTDRMSGRPRGFAFVEFVSGEHAGEAIRRFEGFELDGRVLRVNEATSEPGAGHGIPGGGGGRAFGRPDRPGPRPSRPKGSRRNARARKRSIW